MKNTFRLFLCAAVGAFALSVAHGAAAGPAGDAGNGQAMFQSHCSACHSVDANRVGPKLGGVFGRKAGAAAGYSYSPAVAKSGVTWTAENLDKWLSGPQQFIPGQKMNFNISDAQKRADIIAFLKSQK